MPTGKEDPLGYSYLNIDKAYEHAYAREFEKRVMEGSDRLGLRDIYVIIPNSNEDSYMVSKTVRNAALVNKYANDLGIPFHIKAVILSDQYKLKKGETNKSRSKINRQELEKDKNYLLRLYGGSAEAYLPKVYHFNIDEQIESIIKTHASDYYGQIIDKEKEPRGKGWNMLVSSLATGMNADHKVGIVYLDADNSQVGPDQVLSLGLPLYHIGYGYGLESIKGTKFVKSKFTRYHTEIGDKLLGGRVNLSVAKPLINMFHDVGLVPNIGYPLTGEIGIARNTLWDISIAQKYGIEWATILQLLARNLVNFDLSKEIGLRDEFVEVYIGENHDKPIGEGKLKDEIIKDIEDMSRKILSVNNELLGNYIKKKWSTKEEFMSVFTDYQEAYYKEMENRFTREKMENITGGISGRELFEHSLNVVDDMIQKLYEDDSVIPISHESGIIAHTGKKLYGGDELLVPVHYVRDKIGHGQFDDLLMDIERNRVII